MAKRSSSTDSLASTHSPSTTDLNNDLGAGSLGTAGSPELGGPAGTTGASYTAGSTAGGMNMGGGDMGGGQQGQTQGAARKAKEKAKEEARNLASQAREETSKLAGQAKDHVQHLVTERKDQAADRLGSVVDVLRDVAHRLEENDATGVVGRYANQAADQMDRLTHYLRDNDVGAFVRDTETFARRRPELFLGGTFLAGMLLARFLKASSERRNFDGYEGYGDDLGTAYAGAAPEGASPYAAGYSADYSAGRTPGAGEPYTGAYGTRDRDEPMGG